jgi:hypothetical protein
MHTVFSAILLSGPYPEHVLAFVLILLIPVVVFAVATKLVLTKDESHPGDRDGDEREQDGEASEK